MATNLLKATVNPVKRLRTTLLIAFYTMLALFSVVMGFHDIVTGHRFFGILFLIAAIIFFVLLLIKGNMVFGTSLSTKNDKLYMKKWDNSFLPYNAESGFFSDLKPSKTKKVKVRIEDISMILIGSKDFVKRNISNAGKKFLKALYPFEHSSKKSKQDMVSGLDIFYLETTDENCAFMCIEDYNVKNVVAIINEIYNANPSVVIKVNNRAYKRYIKKLQNAEV